MAVASSAIESVEGRKHSRTPRRMWARLCEWLKDFLDMVPALGDFMVELKR